jgi:hypothetical protein
LTKDQLAALRDAIRDHAEAISDALTLPSARASA